MGAPRPRRALLSLLPLLGLACALGCSPSRYHLTPPAARPGLDSEDRPCVLKTDVDGWETGQLTQQLCGAWSDREMSDIIAHEWIFFPHFLIGSTERFKRTCDDCWLDIRYGEGRQAERPRLVTMTLHVPPDDTVMATYKGGLKGGLFEGPGALTMHRTAQCRRYCLDFFAVNGETATTLTLAGTWHAGVLDPEEGLQASYTLEDGTTYHGEVLFHPRVGVVPHGRGRIVRPDGKAYEGDLSFGEPSGEGRVITSYGDRYAGTWKEGRYHGEGTVLRADGTLETGDWQHGVREGEGRKLYPDGNFYVGGFSAGRRNGQGTLVDVDGFTLQGEWKAGAFLGGEQARIAWEDGHRYEGAMAEGRYHGLGTFTWPDGSFYEGQFHEGRAQGHGVWVSAKGWRYHGAFEADRPHGCGVHVEKDEVTFWGIWSEGAPMRSGCPAPPRRLAQGDEEVVAGFRHLGRFAYDQHDRFRRSRELRAASAEQLDEVKAKYAPFRADQVAEGEVGVEVTLAWPEERHLTTVGRACASRGALELTWGGEPVPYALSGLLDARVTFTAAVGSTAEACATLDGQCGAWRGCAEVELPEEASRLLGARIELSEDEPPGPGRPLPPQAAPTGPGRPPHPDPDL